MVLQREEPIAVWGKAVPGNTVEVIFGKTKGAAVAGIDSAWIVYLPKQMANINPQVLKVSSVDTAVQFHNILVGDVWLCIGQSNMEWPMQRELNYKTEFLESNQPLLRFYNPNYAGKNIFAKDFTDSVIKLLIPEHFYKGNWQLCDSSSIKQMSAVAYYFGKTIATSIDMPIALINLSIGGAPLETFIDPVALQQNKQFAAKVKGDWLQNSSLPVWIKERGLQNMGKNSMVAFDEYGKNHAFKPGFAYKAGIEPLLLFPIKGILNYQGESNAQEKERVEEYAALSALMIQDFRAKWKKPQLPYYYVQLSSIDTVQYKSQLWPQFRNEQRHMMQLIPNSGMAVSSDYGATNDVHPANKKIVGERLARWALYQAYRKKIIPSGPLPVKATYKKGFVRISFQYADGLQVTDGKSLNSFSIDGKEMSEAFVLKKRVFVKSKQKPDYIYYGWQPFSKGNLQNGEQLPASTFKVKVE